MAFIITVGNNKPLNGFTFTREGQVGITALSERIIYTLFCERKMFTKHCCHMKTINFCVRK